jgi:hypothetical protein
LIFRENTKLSLNRTKKMINLQRAILKNTISEIEFLGSKVLKGTFDPDPAKNKETFLPILE